SRARSCSAKLAGRYMDTLVFINRRVAETQREARKRNLYFSPLGVSASRRLKTSSFPPPSPRLRGSFSSSERFAAQRRDRAGGGAVGPAAGRRRAASAAAGHDSGFAPRPTRASVPAMLRTML